MKKENLSKGEREKRKGKGTGELEGIYIITQNYFSNAYLILYM